MARSSAGDPSDIFCSLDDDELEELGAFLISDATSDATLTLSSLDGYLTALVIGPTSVMPSQWLPRIWGESDDDAPEFESMAQAQRILGLIMRHMNGIVGQFQSDPNLFEPIVDMYSEDGVEYVDGETWALGFMRGVELAQADWRPFFESPEFIEAWTPLHLLGSEAATDEELDLIATPALRHELTNQLTGSLAKIHAFWLPWRDMAHAESTLATTPLRRTQPKVGRNDPCPCGSGIKYKKCCGAPATKH
jgi:uncharacterized protein